MVLAVLGDRLGDSPRVGGLYIQGGEAAHEGGARRPEAQEERRALTVDELAALWEAMCEAEEAGMVHPSALLALRLFALTGHRGSELLGHESKKRRGKLEDPRRGDIDLEAGTVRLRQSKTGPPDQSDRPGGDRSVERGEARGCD